MKYKRDYDEFGRARSFAGALIEFAVWLYSWIIFNPIVYTLLVIVFKRLIIAHACKVVETRNNILWPMVAWITCHTGDKNCYWFNYFTKLRYAPINIQVMMVCETDSEKRLYDLYSDKYVDDRVKKYCFWRNSKITEDFRIHMIRSGFSPSLADFKYVLETHQCSVIKEIVKQTISDEYCVLFWEAAIENDGKDILSVFIDYILREGLTPRSITYVMQSYDCLAKKAVLKALETHNAIAFVKRSKANDIFRQLLIKGANIPYEAQCYLTVPLYKIYKETHYELGEKAVIYHLQKEGEMAKVILNEQRDFSSDVLGIIMKSPILTAWYRSRT